MTSFSNPSLAGSRPSTGERAIPTTTPLKASDDQVEKLSAWESLLEAMRKNPARTDYFVALLFVTAMTASILLGYFSLSTVDQRIVRIWSALVAISSMLPLLWRRRYPEAQFAVTFVLYSIAAHNNVPDDSVGLIAIWVSIYGIGAYGGRYRSPFRFISSIAICLTLFYPYDAEAFGGSPRGSAIAYAIAFVLGIIASAWLFGDTMRIRRQQADDLRMRAYELTQERDQNAKRAVTEERLRIARELHDVIAHHVTIIGIQASAADRILEKDPVRARTALSSISTASRETVDELQRLLGFLRPDSVLEQTSGAPEPPQPAMRDLAKLIRDSEEAGVRVTFSSTGDLDSLPGSVSLSAYRIVQEALTNVRKHAPDASTSVSVQVLASWVQVIVENARPTPIRTGRNESKQSGFGLVGMKERARLVGGELSAAPTPNGGWRVEARLPIHAQPLPR